MTTVFEASVLTEGVPSEVSKLASLVPFFASTRTAAFPSAAFNVPSVTLIAAFVFLFDVLSRLYTVTALPFSLVSVPPLMLTVRPGLDWYWPSLSPYISLEIRIAEPSACELPLTGQVSPSCSYLVRSRYLPVPLITALSWIVIVPILASIPLPPSTTAVPPMVNAPSMGQ